MSSNHPGCRCISPTHSFCHVISCIILCIALIVFLLCCRYLYPLGRRCSDVVIVDTDEDSMLSSEVPGKQTPPVHSNTIILSRSCSLLLHKDNNDSFVTCCGSWTPLSSAWPIIATVNRWNPLAWVGGFWALMCPLIHACCHACYCLELCQVWFIGNELEVCEHVLLLRAKCVNTIW